jgi:hypothetical protein
VSGSPRPQLAGSVPAIQAEASSCQAKLPPGSCHFTAYNYSVTGPGPRARARHSPGARAGPAAGAAWQRRPPRDRIRVGLGTLLTYKFRLFPLAIAMVASLDVDDSDHSSWNSAREDASHSGPRAEGASDHDLSHRRRSGSRPSLLGLAELPGRWKTAPQGRSCDSVSPRERILARRPKGFLIF